MPPTCGLVQNSVGGMLAGGVRHAPAPVPGRASACTSLVAGLLAPTVVSHDCLRSPSAQSFRVSRRRFSTSRWSCLERVALCGSYTCMGTVGLCMHGRSDALSLSSPLSGKPSAAWVPWRAINRPMGPTVIERTRRDRSHGCAARCRTVLITIAW